MQEACRAELNWDDELTAISWMGDEWSNWLWALPELHRVSMERSFVDLDREILSVKLHTFADASASGYGTCTYLRVIYVDGLIKCHFVMGKAHVALLKSISVLDLN